MVQLVLLLLPEQQSVSLAVHPPLLIGEFWRTGCTARLFLWVNEMKPKKLIYGIGINDSDYSVAKTEVIGHVDGKRRQKAAIQTDPRISKALVDRYSQYCAQSLTV